jgi:hypothetical protein
MEKSQPLKKYTKRGNSHELKDIKSKVFEIRDTDNIDLLYIRSDKRMLAV